MDISQVIDQINLTHFHGTLSLTGPTINKIATYWINHLQDPSFIQGRSEQTKRDGPDFHITLLSAQEYKACNKLPQLNLESLSDLIFDLGVSSISSKDGFITYFIPIYSHKLQQFRLDCNLFPKDFHITLSFIGNDIHDQPKTIKSIKWTDNHIFSKIKSYLKSSKEINIELAQYLYQHNYLSGLYYLSKSNLKSLGLKHTYEYIRDELLNNTSIFKFDELDSEQEYIDKILKILNHSLTIEIFDQRFEKLARFYTFEYGKFNYINMPRNFSFVNNKIGGSSIFTKPQQFDALRWLGVTDVITLMEYPLNQDLYGSSINYHWFEIQDLFNPTIEQMHQIIKIIDNSPKIIIHCRGGVGRTATVLAAWLMWDQGISRQEAMQPILKERKTNLTDVQEQFLSQWYAECRKKLDKQVTVGKIKFPPLLMMIGYPSSGKSSFSQSIVNAYQGSVVRLNQDEDGRKKCESEIGKLVKKSTVILDRCNLSKTERSEWLKLSMAKKTWVVFFDVDFEECKWRIVRRQNHPTIKQGGGLRILKSLEGTLEPPNLLEGFDKIITIKTFEQANALLILWGCVNFLPQSTIPIENHLIKFPRTRHVLNLGSATRDDLLMSKSEVAHFLNREIYIEEKIDGANLGISIRNNTICFQNRSHFVNSSYHPQFKYLEKWTHQRSSELWQILIPDRHILYGEWVYAQHSIGYQNLPDWFIAFDLFDRLENKFYSRNRLEQLLLGTTIALIPLIAHKSFDKIDDIKSLIQTKSQFYDGPVEGAYLRIMDADDQFLEQRGKIVRSDFISGNTHWSKNIITPNKLIV